MEGKSNPEKGRTILILFILLVPSSFIIGTNSVFASTSSDYDYQLINNGTAVEITRYYGHDGTVSIPGNIDGWPVISLGFQAFSNNTYVKSILIHSNV
jgi:hypothetical protein